jgi:AcrR family transcriptional regulator
VASKVSSIRKDPRREATRLALIESAETLFAQAGIDGVSTRQIGAAIGSANNNVVNYYFGSKEALIEAIYRQRLPALEIRRAELLEKAEARGRGKEIATLMYVLCLPLWEQTNSKGKHSYAGFLASISRSGWGWTRVSLDADFPVTQKIIERMQRLVPADVRYVFADRLKLLSSIIWRALSVIDEHARPKHGATVPRLFTDAVQIATVAIVAPIRSPETFNVR